MRETISLPPSGWIRYEQNLVIIDTPNSRHAYDPDSYILKPSTQTQRDFLVKHKLLSKPKRPTPKKPTPNTPKAKDTLDSELNQLVTIGHLKKKLNTHFNNIDTLRTLTDEDKRILKTRSIAKSKKTIAKYLKTLRDDSKFNIRRVKHGIALNYLGVYCATKRVIFCGGEC